MSEFKQIGFGAVLRQRREELGLSLNDLAASTRVRKTYLQALEEENLRMLPGAAYAVGFLRIYARQLGLPVAPLLTALTGDETLEEQGALPALAGDFPRGGKKSRRKQRAGRPVLWGVLLLAMLTAAGYVYYRSRPQALPAKPAAAPVPQGVPAPAPPVQKAVPSQPPAQPVSGPPAAPAQPAAPPVELAVIPPGGTVVKMVPLGRGTMKVSLDGQEIREYQLQPDHALNWKVSASLSVELSEPGLVKVWVGQQEQPVAEHPLFTLTAVSGPGRRP